MIKIITQNIGTYGYDLFFLKREDGGRIWRILFRYLGILKQEDLKNFGSGGEIKLLIKLGEGL